jgi:hypothetical protein
MTRDYNMMSDKFPRYPFYGITFGNQSFFVLVGTFSTDDRIDYAWSRRFFRNKTIENQHNKLFFNHKKQISNFLISYPNRHIIFRIITISFRVYCNTSVDHPFDLPKGTEGKFFEGKSIKLHINGFEFDFFRYSKEVRIFGVFMGFCVLLTLHSWRELRRFTSVAANSSLISLTTLLIAFDHDVSSCLVLTFLSDAYFPPSLLLFF